VGMLLWYDLNMRDRDKTWLKSLTWLDTEDISFLGTKVLCKQMESVTTVPRLCRNR
jgi:hypothetical protein